MIDPWSIGDIRVFILDPCPSPKADGHYYYHRYCHSVVKITPC